MFELRTFTPVKGKTINIRSENHGSEHVPAVDWAVAMEVPNTALALLGPELLDQHYMAVENADEEGQQGRLDGVEAVSPKPLLRSHNLKYPVGLNHDLAGYQLTVDRGLGGKSNLVLLECKVNKVTIDCKEGGTVVIAFRIQATHVNEEVRGQLSSYIKGATTSIALKPPEMKQDPIDGTGAEFAKDHPGAAAAPAAAPAAAAKPAKPANKTKAKDKATAATDAFVAAHGSKTDKVEA